MTIFKVGDKVVKNPDNWEPTEFDNWGRGQGIGTIFKSPFSDDAEEVDVVWPKGRCFEKISGILPVSKLENS